MMFWTEGAIHFIDFEGSLESGILEYGLATLKNGKITETKTRLCRPTGRVRERDVATHQIREEQAMRFAPFSDEWALFTDCRRTGPLAAHFASTENSLIKSVWPYPPASPDFTGIHASLVEWGPWVDTGRILPALFRNLPDAGLEALIGAFSLQEELDSLAKAHCPGDRAGYHCALYDAMAAALLLLEVGRCEAYRNKPMGWLLEMSAGTGKKREELRQTRLF
ncbi:MAG: 3'-5' exonuclease [Opitutales bacterium]